MKNKIENNSLNHLAIDCRQISYKYPDGRIALQKIDLQIPDGQKTGIIGPNGAGKSTFLSLLNGTRQAEGQLHIYDLEVNKANDKKIKTMVGLVFQNPDEQLFCPTIFEDVAFGPLNLGLNNETVAERVSIALEEVGLTGYEHRSSIHLSYGEKKLASIASILSMQPRLIAMDEPTSNLDHLHRRKIINWIKETPRTIIITSHDLDLLLETCQRVIILNAGQKVADGTINKILSDDRLLGENNLEPPLSFRYEQNRNRIWLSKRN